MLYYYGVMNKYVEPSNWLPPFKGKKKKKLKSIIVVFAIIQIILGRRNNSKSVYLYTFCFSASDADRRAAHRHI